MKSDNLQNPKDRREPNKILSENQNNLKPKSDHEIFISCNVLKNLKSNCRYIE